MRINLPATGVKGFLKLQILKAVLDSEGNQVYDAAGHAVGYENTRRTVVDWFPNTFLNVGREEIARRGDWMSWCQVGTNSLTPSPTQTSLQGWFAATNDIVVTSDAAQASEPYYGYLRNTYRHPAGSVAAILSEVAVGWSNGIGNPDIVARTLIVDNLGVPTTVVPQIDEILDVLYELRYYPFLGESAGTITLDGLVYDTITRASSVNAPPQHRAIGQQMQHSTVIDSFDYAAFDGELGTILQTPSGTIASLDKSFVTSLAYGSNNYYRDATLTIGATKFNLVAGIRSTTFTSRGGRYQTRYGRQGGGDETIPKTIEQTMELTFRTSWAGWLFDGPWEAQAANNVTTPTTGNWNTNLAETLLRVNWTDDSPVSRQEELKTPRDTTFHMQDSGDLRKWVEYTMVALTDYTEGTDWTEYTVTKTAEGPDGAPATSTVCVTRVMTP